MDARLTQPVWLVLLACLTGCSATPLDPPGRAQPPATQPTTLKPDIAFPPTASALRLGVNFADWNDAFDTTASREALEHLRGTGLGLAVFVPTWYQDALDAVEIRALPGNTPREETLAADLRRARDMGFETGIKVHIDPLDGEARHHIAFQTEAAFLHWWSQYRELILRHAGIARDTGCSIFFVGTELSGLTGHPYTQHWRALIADVRRALGPAVRISYAARHQNIANIAFLDDLDVIGVNAWPYFRVEGAVTVDSLRRSWRAARYYAEDFVSSRGWTNTYEAVGFDIDFFGFLRWVAETYDKPICISEVGCQSRQGALTRPVAWRSEGNPDGLAQALFFDAFFTELQADRQAYTAQTGRAHPVESVLIWNYMIKPGGPRDTDYTFRNKPLSERILRRHALTARNP